MLRGRRCRLGLRAQMSSFAPAGSAPTLIVDATMRGSDGRPKGVAMSSVHTPTLPDERSHRPTLVHPPPPEARHNQWRWLAAGLVLVFAIPFVLTDLTSINRDLYYGSLHRRASSDSSPIVAALRERVGPCGADAQLARRRRRRPRLRRRHGGDRPQRAGDRPHPGGLDFVAAIAWRGVLYGLADGLILSAFPILAVFAAFEGRARARALAREDRGRRPRPRRLAAVHRRLPPRLLRLPRREAQKASRRATSSGACRRW